MTSPLRALVVINRADDATGGSLRAAINTAEAMAAAGADVTMAVPLHRPITALEQVSAMDPRITLILFRTSKPFARFGGSVAHAVWIFRNVRRFDSVQIHTLYYLAAIYTALICRLRKVPYYIWPHGSLNEYDLRQHRRIKDILGRLFYGRLIGGATSILCASAREADDLILFGSHPRRDVISLPVAAPVVGDVNRTAWRARHGIAQDAFVVLFLGRIDPKKGLDRLVAALALLSTPGTLLAIAGAAPDSVEALELIRQAEQLGVGHAVRFLGWLEGDDRTGAYVGADVFVLPSDNENFGIAVVEALLLDLPVVISDQVYISADLREVDGAVIAGREPEQIAAALEQVRRDPEGVHAITARGRAFAEANYGATAVGERLLALPRRVPG